MTIGLIANNDGSGAIQLGGSNAIALDTSFNATMAGYVNAPNTFGFKNRIINGAMVIDQRNNGASVDINNGYSLDRWGGLVSVASKFTVQQNAGSVTPPAGFSRYLGATSSSAYNVQAAEVFAIRQAIEGLNISDLAWGTASAAAVTLSFWVRSSLTGTFGGALRNSGATRSYPFSYTISAANTWEQKTITIAGDTSGTWLTTNGIGIELDFSMGTGATLSGTAGAWAGANYTSATGATSVVATNGATFYITGVQVEKGSIATSFDYRDYGRELMMCQRYFYNLVAAAASAASTTTVEFYYQHPVPMRTAPSSSVIGTMRIEDPSVTTYTQSSGASAISQASPLGMKLAFSNFTGLTSARPYYVASLATNVTASPPTSVCQISAEL
jgi:hypothetical protein